VLNLATTRTLLDRLYIDVRLRRICGFLTRKDIPSESVFSRVFAEFAQNDIAQKLHQAIIPETQSQRLIGHISKDSTAIEARERPKIKAKTPQLQIRRSRGRPRKDEIRPAKQQIRIEQQQNMSLSQMLLELLKSCDVGTKRNSKGHQTSWIGYKLHIDVADGQIPISAILTSASVHDSQVAIPLATMSSQRVTSLYDLMDAAYDCEEIKTFSRSLGHIPIIDENPQCNGKSQEKRPKETKFEKTHGLATAISIRYNERSTVERVNARLKDEFGGRNIWVKGYAKVACHLFFALAALSADQIMRLIQ
ncbi:MAG: transposase, partial [Deltaproteobacteria bacterium]|nr:transposase [Deltaproteobacteria bacterium]